MDLVGKICPDGRIYVEQGVVAGCSGGTYENICAVADIIRGKSCGNGEFRFSVYPDSMPTYLELVKNGAVADIVSAGGIFRAVLLRPLLRRRRCPRQRRASPSATPPATSPTARAPSPARGRSARWP